MTIFYFPFKNELNMRRIKQKHCRFSTDLAWSKKKSNSRKELTQNLLIIKIVLRNGIIRLKQKQRGFYRTPFQQTATYILSSYT